MTLKKFLPYESYILQSQLSAMEIERRLLDNVQPKRSVSERLFSNGISKPYEGDIRNQQFSISRIITYRNSFLPIVTGNIVPGIGNADIQIRMRMSAVVTIFMIMWLGIIGTVSITLLVTFLNNPEQNKQFITFAAMFPIVMFIIGFAMIHFGFKRESKKAKIFLADLLEGIEKGE